MLVMALGMGTSSAGAVDFAPDPRRHDVYQAPRQRQQRLYDTVVGPGLS